MSNLIITSTVAGVVPTTDNLKEGVLGVNTADGKMYVNNGTKIVSTGGSVWKPSSEPIGLKAEIPVGGNWNTMFSVNTECLVTGAYIECNGTFTGSTLGIRVTVDGVQISEVSRVSASSQLIVGAGIGGWLQMGSGYGIYSGAPIHVESSIVVEGLFDQVSGVRPIIKLDYVEGEY